MKKLEKIILGVLMIFIIIYFVIVIEPGWGGSLERQSLGLFGDAFGLITSIFTIIAAYIAYNVYKTTKKQVEMAKEKEIEKLFLSFKIKFLAMGDCGLRGFNIEIKNPLKIEELFVHADYFCLKSKNLNKSQQEFLERLFLKFYQELWLIIIKEKKHETYEELKEFYKKADIKTIDLFNNYLKHGISPQDSIVPGLPKETLTPIFLPSIYKLISFSISKNDSPRDINKKQFIEGLIKDERFEKDFPHLLKTWNKLIR